MGSTEGGEEVIERVFVGDVDSSQAEAPFVAVALEEVVLTNRRVEKATRLDTRRVVVVVARTRSGDVDQAGGELRCDALVVGRAGDGCSEQVAPVCLDSAAGESALKFLVGAQGQVGKAS